MKTIITAIIAAAVSSTAAAQDYKHYELNVGEFHELEVTDAINVDYEHNSYKAGKVEFDATSDVADAIIFRPAQGKLQIELATRDTVYPTLPTVRVYSSFLSKISNEGDSTVRVITINPGPTLDARLIGNGRLVLRDVRTTNADMSILTGRGTLVVYGTAENTHFNITGAGTIQADEFRSNAVSCTLTGTGSLFCYPGKTLNVKGMGSIKVYYRGNPKIKKSWLSNAKIISLDDESAEKK